MEKVCILGGGASALMCACFIKNKEVTIFERADKVGKKILATGNGRCNLLNINMNECSYNQVLDEYFKRFNSADVLEFFNKIGLETYVDDEGRVYPISNTATSVLAVLKNNIDQNKNVKIVTNKEFFDLKYEKNGYKVEFCDQSFEFFDKVVVASGNYSNIKIFDKFGIKYKEFVPSLCSLKTEKHKALSGIRVDNVCVSCDDVSFSEIGEILFKDDGISGIVIFNLSSFLARRRLKQAKLKIDFLPNNSMSCIIQMLKTRRQNLSYLNNVEFLTGLFHKQVNFEILKRADINLNQQVKLLNDKQIDKIAKIIKSFELNVCGFFENNQVCSGGVLLSELNFNLQSKNNRGLYFIGEIIDVDGVCGGYNLGWAWTSGKILGESI